MCITQGRSSLKRHAMHTKASVQVALPRLTDNMKEIHGAQCISSSMMSHVTGAPLSKTE